MRKVRPQGANLTRYGCGPRAHRLSMGLLFTLTRSAGVTGPVCSTAMTCRVWLGPTTSSKAAAAYEPPPVADDGPPGPHTAYAATPRCVGTPATAPDRRPVTRGG